MDCYAVLGVTRSSTRAQIKDAYRRNARRLHPDVNPDPWAAERFKEMTSAYEVLRDDTRRAKYDAANPVPDFTSSPATAERGTAREQNVRDVSQMSDAALLLAGKNVVIELRRSRRAQRPGSTSEAVYGVAAEILEKSIIDFEAALRHPLVQAHRPVVLVTAERFLRTVDPGGDIAQVRSSEHLRSGTLGMVGLARVTHIVGREADPQTKEAAARAIMFALAGALLDAGLIQPPVAQTVGRVLTAASYADVKRVAFAELESSIRSSWR